MFAWNRKQIQHSPGIIFVDFAKTESKYTELIKLVLLNNLKYNLLKLTSNFQEINAHQCTCEQKDDNSCSTREIYRRIKHLRLS